MKTTLLGFEHIAGTSKDGNPYDFAQLHVAVPNEHRQNHQSFAGMVPATLSVEPSVLKSLKGLAFPCDVEIEMEQRLTARGPRSVITGVKA